MSPCPHVPIVTLEGLVACFSYLFTHAFLMKKTPHPIEQDPPSDRARPPTRLKGDMEKWGLSSYLRTISMDAAALGTGQVIDTPPAHL